MSVALTRLFLSSLVFLLILPSTRAATSSCSTTVSCVIEPTSESFDAPAKPTPSFIAPTGLRNYHIIKTNPTSGSLYPVSSLRWSLPSSDHPVPIQGFAVVLTPKDKSHEPIVYKARLTEPLTMNATEIEAKQFFVELDGVLSLGVQYRFEVIILPHEAGSSTATTFNMPPAINETARCDTRGGSKNQPEDHRLVDALGNPIQRAARLWTTDFKSVRTLEALPAVNVTFYAAPDALCVNSYEVQVTEETGKVLGSVILYQNSSYMHDGILYLSHIFYNLPVDQRVVVKVEVRNEKDRCVCERCDCMSVKSGVIQIARRRPVTETPTSILHIPAPEQTEQSPLDKVLSIFFIAGFLFLLACCIVLIVLLRSRSFAQRDKIILRNGKLAQILLEEGEKPQPFGFRRVLIVASHDDPLESKLVDELSCIVTLSPFTVVYMDKKERHVVEKNYHKWVHSKVSVADKIVVLHTRVAAKSLQASSPTGLSPVFRTLLSAVSPYDTRLVHVKLEEKCPLLLPAVETCYRLPRDRSFFMHALDLPYMEADWKTYQELSKRLSDGVPRTPEPGEKLRGLDELIGGAPVTSPSVTISIDDVYVEEADDEEVLSEHRLLLTRSLSLPAQPLHIVEPLHIVCDDEEDGVDGCDSGIALSCEMDSLSKHSISS